MSKNLTLTQRVNELENTIRSTNEVLAKLTEFLGGNNDKVVIENETQGDLVKRIKADKVLDFMTAKGLATAGYGALYEHMQALVLGAKKLQGNEADILSDIDMLKGRGYYSAKTIESLKKDFCKNCRYKVAMYQLKDKLRFAVDINNNLYFAKQSKKSDPIVITTKNIKDFI